MRTAIFLLSFVFALVANAQQSAITAIEYEKALDSAVTLSAKRIRRITTVVETRTKERPITSRSRHVEEYIPPEIERFVDTITSGDVSASEEIIQIGRSGFQKKDKTLWVEWTGSPPRSLAPGTASICGKYSKEVCSYSSMESELEGQVVRVLSRKGEKNLNGLVGREVDKVWITRDGALLRTELVLTEGDKKEWVKRIVSTWEYDPAGMKIEAPINNL